MYDSLCKRTVRSLESTSLYRSGYRKSLTPSGVLGLKVVFVMLPLRRDCSKLYDFCRTEVSKRKNYKTQDPQADHAILPTITCWGCSNLVRAYSLQSRESRKSRFIRARGVQGSRLGIFRQSWEFGSVGSVFHHGQNPPPCGVGDVRSLSSPSTNTNKC